MTEKLILRHARPQDSRALAQVHIDTWRHTYAGMVPDRYLASMTLDGQARSWRQWIEACSARDTILLVETCIEDGGPSPGRIIAFGHAGPARSGDPAGLGEVYTLYVDIDWQGRGIGRHLLSQLFESLIEAGMEAAMLWVLANNPSRFFYEAMGGRRIAERREPFAGVLLDEIAYNWPDLTALQALKPGV